MVAQETSAHLLAAPGGVIAAPLPRAAIAIKGELPPDDLVAFNGPSGMGVGSRMSPSWCWALRWRLGGRRARFLNATYRHSLPSSLDNSSSK